jgi:hypothetical protein
MRCGHELGQSVAASSLGAPTAVPSVSSTKKSKKVVFQKATYLGGLPGDKGG